MSLDLVIPAHNEENRIDLTLSAYRSQIPEHDTRFIVALDACTDRTASVVARHADLDDRVLAWAYPKLGKGGVIMEAFRHCHAELVGFVDADCATPPSELGRLVGTTRVADGAIASRRHPSAVLPAARPITRRVTSAAFAHGVRHLFRLPYQDTQCGAKVLRREVMETVAPFLSSRDFLFDVDLLVTARALGFHIVEVPTVWIDQTGSRVRAGADARRMAASSARLWLHHRVMPVPPAGVARARP